jgi:hypothetical protein
MTEKLFLKVKEKIPENIAFFLEIGYTEMTILILN